MMVFLNGEFVAQEQAVVSVFDRGFLYGDGLFEGVRVLNGKLFRWDQHLQRLERGAQFLKIKLPLPADSLRESAERLVSLNQAHDTFLRLTVSRGVGIRGYSPRGADRPSVVMSLHPLPTSATQGPPQWRLVVASFRLPAGEPLAQFKTCNKLPQILARAEADAAGADEALLLNTDGHVVEASSSNLFWMDHDNLCTPPLASGILAGVTRAVVLELAQNLNLPVLETRISPQALHQSAGVFVSLSTAGIAEAISLDGQPLRRSPVVARIRDRYEQLLQEETA
jgi:branched-chain amino acid aminotransferase